MFETGQKKTEKRKKFKENDASNIDGFLGPWAKYIDEKDVAKPSEVSIACLFGPLSPSKYSGSKSANSEIYTNWDSKRPLNLLTSVRRFSEFSFQLQPLH